MRIARLTRSGFGGLSFLRRQRVLNKNMKHACAIEFDQARIVRIVHVAYLF